MIVKNEEKSIGGCLDSVKDIVDEIVIVDTGSTDQTINTVERFPKVRVFHFQWCDDFALARNYSIEHATGDYILVLDADEFIVDGARNELEKVMSENAIGRILIDSHFKKGNQKHHSKAYVSRFFPKDIRYTGAIHEQLVSDKIKVNMNLNVKHDGYFETNKSKRNIPLLLKEAKRNPVDSYYLFQLGKELRISEQYKEAFRFLEKSYAITKRTVPYYAEIVVELIYSGKEFGEVKLFEIISHNEEILNYLSDFHFAKGMFYLEYCLKHPDKAGILMGEIEVSFLKCLTLENGKFTEYVRGTCSYLAAYNLGVYYEVIGSLSKAIEYYQLSAELGYLPAVERFGLLK